MALTLSATQSKTGFWFLSVYQCDGVTPQNITGMTLWFHAALASFRIDKSSPSSGITIINPLGGLNCASLQIEPGDTASLSIGSTGRIQMPCELTLQNESEEYELAKGTLSLVANVGTP
jgi:hypothetical protein